MLPIFIFLLSIITLTGATGAGVAPPNACYNSSPLKLNFFQLLTRQTVTCNAGFVPCQTFCIPSGTSCCADGGYCKPGNYCFETGCCPNNTTCSGVNSACTGTDQPCQGKCMPGGSVCCPNGSYCNAGQSCSGQTCVNNTGNGTATCPTNQIYCVNTCIDSTRTCCGSQGLSCPAGYRCDSVGGCQPLGTVDCGNGRYCDSGEVCVNVVSDTAQCSRVNAASTSPAAPNLSGLVGSATILPQSVTTPAPSPSSTSQASSSRSFAPVATSALNPGGSGATNSYGSASSWNLGFLVGMFGLFL